MTEVEQVTDEMLGKTLALIDKFPTKRCSVAYLKWMLGLSERDDADQVMKAIRDVLSSLNLIGWSYPAKGPAEMFLSDHGRIVMKERAS